MIRIFGSMALVISMLGTVSQSPAQVLTYFGNLNGPNEPTNSPGIGTARVDYNPTTHMMRVQATFSGLVGNTTAAHIHAATATPGTGTAGVATQTPSFSGFPLGVTSGSMDTTFDMTLASSYNPAYVTANGGTPASAEAALFTAMAQGRSYFNIHSSVFPGGEIRDFLTVPEPTSLALIGVAALAGLRRVIRRNRKAV